MTAPVSLPSGFEELEPFVAQWTKSTFQQRLEARSESAMADIESFYGAAAPRVPEMITALEGVSPEDRSPEQRRLYELLLGLAHVAHAVERYGQPTPKHTAYPNRLRVIAGPRPE
jgi:hypothetical protein